MFTFCLPSLTFRLLIKKEDIFFKKACTPSVPPVPNAYRKYSWVSVVNIDFSPLICFKKAKFFLFLKR